MINIKDWKDYTEQIGFANDEMIMHYIKQQFGYAMIPHLMKARSIEGFLALVRERQAFFL